MRPITSLLWVLFALISQSTSAQPPEWQWARSSAGEEFDVANAVTTDAMGNVIVVGYFSSDSIAFGDITVYNNTPGFDDLYIVKYNAAGNVLWANGGAGGGVAGCGGVRYAINHVRSRTLQQQGRR